MSANVGMADRVVRLVIGIALIAWAIPIGFAPGQWNWIGWIGVVPILTAIFANCPLYSMIGVSTCPLKR